MQTKQHISQAPNTFFQTFELARWIEIMVQHRSIIKEPHKYSTQNSPNGLNIISQLIN